MNTHKKDELITNLKDTIDQLITNLKDTIDQLINAKNTLTTILIELQKENTD